MNESLAAAEDGCFADEPFAIGNFKARGMGESMIRYNMQPPILSPVTTGFG